MILLLSDIILNLLKQKQQQIMIKQNSNKLFNKRKFLSLEYKQQHKKCAELLKYVYEYVLKNECYDASFEHYNELQTWLELPILTSHDLKDIADKYHWHLKQAEVSFREHNLLTEIHHHDRPAPLQEPLPIAIYLDKIRSAHNVGSIIRTTETLAIGSLYFSENMAFKDNKQVADAAMGTEQWVACHQNISLEELPRPIIALETADNAINIYDFVFPKAFTLVLGNEEYGCSNKSLQMADYILKIPAIGKKNSLNVANAFAIAAGEIFRQNNNNLTEIS